MQAFFPVSSLEFDQGKLDGIIQTWGDANENWEMPTEKARSTIFYGKHLMWSFCI